MLWVARQGRAFCHPFFTWYNTEHRHTGLGLLTPAMVHFGQAALVRAQRGAVLAAAYAAHPERFVRQPPEPPALPTAVWINAPSPAGALPGVHTRLEGATTPSPSRVEPLRGPRIDSDEGGRYLDTPRNPASRPAVASPQPRRDSKCEPSVSQSR